MSATPPPQEVGGILKRIHELGASTELIFNRLYLGLNRRYAALQRDHSDLSDRLLERETELERFHQILASIHEGVIIQDLEGRMVLMNQAARQLLGSQKHFWTSELGSLFNAHRHVHQTSSELAPLGEPQRLSLNERVLQAQLVALADSKGRRMGTLILLRDLTQEDLAERLKRSFVAHISHELNTPMNVMRVASEVLLGQAEDEAPNRRMLTLLSKNIDLLSRMIRELLDVSQLSGGNMMFKRDVLSLEPLLLGLCQSLEPEVQQAQLSLTVMLRDSDQLLLQGDAERLQMALGHILRNSILYNEPKGEIILTARRIQSLYRDEIAISISDTGVGIAETDLPHIFKLFYRGQPRTRAGKRLDPRGLGQGLYIAQTIIQAHQGQIHVQSQLGQGSVFTIHLPRYAAPPVLPALPD